MIAGVSTPTISRFENGEKDIQLSTIISILSVLGMNDQRNLIFPTANERYDTTRMILIFTGQDGKKAIRCAISAEALEDYFNRSGSTKNLLKAFQTNRETIEHEARRKYLAGNLEVDGSILVKTSDLG
jgi:transcriptional regulator with XRE-family HTH domain